MLRLLLPLSRISKKHSPERDIRPLVLYNQTTFSSADAIR